MNTFPLPLSNNWRVFGLSIVTGPLAGNKVIFPGEFKKTHEEQFEPRHVFILQNTEEKYFTFVYWKYNQRSPTLLPTEAWDTCFDKSNITKVSNRYLLTVRGRSLILPYLPDSLHQRWAHQNLVLNKIDLTFTNAVFQKLIKPLFQIHSKRHIRRAPFTGWQKKNTSKTKNAIQSYKQQLMKERQQINPTNIDITIPFEKLEKKQRDQVKMAFQLMLNLFPNFIYSTE